jgi:beta-glucanase (GH16 family)
VASVLILGGIVIRPDVAAGEYFSIQHSATQLSNRTKVAKPLIDPTQIWVYSFGATRSHSLDPSIWETENGTETADYNNEQQTYTDRPENVRIEDGALVIEARAEQWNSRSYTSARINTRNAFSFTYGILEVDMKLPHGTGSWPAAWLMPSNDRYKQSNYSDVSDPSRVWALNGEIDFMEAVGYLPGQIIPATHSYNSLGRSATYTPGFVKDQYDTYHKYGVIKTPDSITFTIDGAPYASRVKMDDSPLEWPYNQPYYLILNLAIGGKWAGAQGIDQTVAPWKMSVRSISYKPL